MYHLKWPIAALYAACITAYGEPVENSLYETFDTILGGVKSELLGDKLLKSCHEEENMPCRMPLVSEPRDAPELLPFLLRDEETMLLWRAHFVRHAKALNQQDKPDIVFWSSRPAASHGAYQYLLSKMEKHQIGSWEAHVSPRFMHVSIKEAQMMMGVKHSMPTRYTLDTTTTDTNSDSNSDNNTNTPTKRTTYKSILPSKRFGVHEVGMAPVCPENFDAREVFAYCRDVINHIHDQGRCGSCWAVSATSTLNDRACIASQGKFKIELSAQHTTSCCDEELCASYGCEGGMPDYAWQWFVSGGGVVSGGDYGDLETHPGATCWPYEAPNSLNKRNKSMSGTPECRTACLDTKYKIPFNKDKHKAHDAFVVEGDFKQSLMEGPLTTTLTVYEDFLMYKKGVYAHVTGEKMGKHAVKMIGWGKEDDQDYWLAVNSWNTTWGDEGLFKIKSGDSDFGELTVGGTVIAQDHDDKSRLEL